MQDTFQKLVRLDRKIQVLKEELNSVDRQLLINAPETNYYRLIQALPLTSSYQFIPPSLKRTSNQIQVRYGQKTASIYHRLALCFFIQNSLVSLHQEELFPEIVVSFYERYFDHIIEHIFEDGIDRVNYYDFENDLFLKDLNLCSLRMFPAGSQVVERSAAPKRFVVSGGASQFHAAASFYWQALKGKTSFYQLHLDTRWLNDFNRAGLNQFYQVIAEMLKSNPEVGGIFGGSWFYDPELERISPGLLYLRKIPEQGGARFFRVGSSSLDIQNATYQSERRKRLYEAGHYIPTNYVFIWLRNDLLQWAESASEFSVSSNKMTIAN